MAVAGSLAGEPFPPDRRRPRGIRPPMPPDLPAPVAAIVRLVSKNAAAVVGLAAVIGIAFQDLAALVRPTLPYLIFILMALAFLQVDPAALARRLRQPVRAVLADGWICVALPAIILSAAILLGFQESDPDILLMIFLVTAPTPLISAPTIAAIMGLDAALMLAVVLFAQAMVPLTAPLVATVFIEPDLPLTPGDLAFRLALIVGLAFVLSTAVRRVAGPERVAAGRPVFDCLAIFFMVWFGVGSMDGIRAAAIERPGMILGLLAFAYGLALFQMALTYAVFRRGYGADAVVIAYAAGNRNIGLLVAALGIMALPERVWFFFALAQIPIFTLPFLLKGLAGRMGGVAPGGLDAGARARKARGADGEGAP